MAYRGIDYGMGQTNIDKSTGIRFGVIAINALNEYAWESLEAQHGEPSCPKCGDECLDAHAEDFAGKFAAFHQFPEEGVIENPQERTDRIERLLDDCTEDYHCLDCAYSFYSDEAFGDEPLGWTLDEDGIIGESAFHNTELFVTKSPYFTYATFCSPCAPGACSMDQGSADEDDTGGGKCYCLPKDWFDQVGDDAGPDARPCPYAYWRVDTGELVYTPPKKAE